MIELTGTLKERLDAAIRLAYTEVSEEELEHFRSVYEKAQIHLFSSSEAFYMQYGGVFKNHYLVLTNPIYNGDVYLGCYADFFNPRDLTPDVAALRGLEGPWSFLRQSRISQDNKSVPLPKSAIIILPMSMSVKTVFCIAYTNSRTKLKYSIPCQRYWKAT